MTEAKPLQPLSNGGNVLIVGAKASNFDDEIRTHPRVILWDSQNQHWTDKSVPQNVRVIFMTRFIGHTVSTKLLAEARKRQLTIFNPDGTGMIVKQVKELLAINPPFTPIVPTLEPKLMPEPEKKKHISGKLKALEPFIDLNMNNANNARALIIKAKELGIDTTTGSIGQMLTVYRRKHGLAPSRRQKTRVTITHKQIKTVNQVDVSVQILDGMIKGLTDMRDFILETVEENRTLRSKLNRFKELIGE